jgi:uncharacterized protein YbjT (DUF2867 family)
MTDEKIAVYGASGYTGRLVVAELARRDIPVVLAGRSIQRLRAAAEGAGVPDAELRLAPLDDPAALAHAFRDSAAVINAAGPFTLRASRSSAPRSRPVSPTSTPRASRDTSSTSSTPGPKRPSTPA